MSLTNAVTSLAMSLMISSAWGVRLDAAEPWWGAGVGSLGNTGLDNFEHRLDYHLGRGNVAIMAQTTDDDIDYLAEAGPSFRSKN